jgi:hypothetical protein
MHTERYSATSIPQDQFSGDIGNSGLLYLLVSGMGIVKQRPGGMYNI